MKAEISGISDSLYDIHLQLQKLSLEGLAGVEYEKIFRKRMHLHYMRNKLVRRRENLEANLE